MRGLFPRTLLPLFLVLFCLPSFTQDKDAVRIGVAVLRSGTEKVSVTEARDRLVKALNQQKPDKKLKLRVQAVALEASQGNIDRKSTRLNSSHLGISYAVFCL